MKNKCNPLNKGPQRRRTLDQEVCTNEKAAETALRESKQLIQSLMENSQIGVLVIDDAHRLTFVNDQMSQITGYSRQETIGRDFREFLDSETGRLVADRYTRRQRGEDVPSRYEFDVIHKDGKMLRVKAIPTVMRHTASQVQTVAQIIDISRHKQAEQGSQRRRQERKLRKKLNTAMTSTADLSEALHQVCAEAADYLQVPHVNIAILNSQQTAVEVVAGHHPPNTSSPLGRVIPIARNPLLRAVINQKKVLATCDSQENLTPAPIHDLMQERKILSVLMVPIFDRGEVIGAFSLENVDSGEFGDSEIDLIQLVASQVGQFLRHRRAEEEQALLPKQIHEPIKLVEQIVNTVPEGIVLLNTDLAVLKANPPGQEYLQTLARASVGATLTHLGECTVKELLTTANGLWREVATGNSIFEICPQPLEDCSGISGWVLVIRDATEEEKVRRHALQQDRLATIGQLAAGIAHDFGNIMAVIVLYAQLSLRTPNVPPKIVERLKTIEHQAKWAADLIRQILDLSRRSDSKLQPLDLLPMVKEQVKLLQRILPESIEIDLSFQPGEYLVNADPTGIQQAIMNLAVNARDAMLVQGGGQLQIVLRKMQTESKERSPLPEMETGDWVLLKVSDNGTGIRPDVLPHIFEPFFTTKAPDKGTGLGLAQVRSVVNQHKGHIDVRSRLSDGTDFSIFLPALSYSQLQHTIGDNSYLNRGSGETILLVEDSETTRKALAEGLQELNYRVLEAENGRKALDLFAKHRSEIALVLSDNVMPIMGGGALVFALRERGITIPTVVMSGHPIDDERDELKAAGVSDWLIKPPTLQELAEAISAALGRGSRLCKPET